GRSKRAVLASEIRKLEIANRRMNSPLPGPAFAKFEYSRCNEFHSSTPTLGNEHRTGKPEIEPRISLFRVKALPVHRVRKLTPIRVLFASASTHNEHTVSTHQEEMIANELSQGSALSQPLRIGLTSLEHPSAWRRKRRSELVRAPNIYELR